MYGLRFSETLLGSKFLTRTLMGWLEVGPDKAAWCDWGISLALPGDPAMPDWEIRRRNRIFHRLGNANWLWPSLKECVMFRRQCIVQCSFNWVEDYNDHHQPLFSGEMPIEMKKHKAVEGNEQTKSHNGREISHKTNTILCSEIIRILSMYRKVGSDDQKGRKVELVTIKVLSRDQWGKGQ